MAGGSGWERNWRARPFTICCLVESRSFSIRRRPQYLPRYWIVSWGAAMTASLGPPSPPGRAAPRTHVLFLLVVLPLEASFSSLFLMPESKSRLTWLAGWGGVSGSVGITSGRGPACTLDFSGFGYLRNWLALSGCRWGGAQRAGEKEAWTRGAGCRAVLTAQP